MTVIIMPSAQRIAFLICSYLNGSITEAQISELRDWLEEKSEHLTLFRLLNNQVYKEFARCELLN